MEMLYTLMRLLLQKKLTYHILYLITLIFENDDGHIAWPKKIKINE